MIKAGFTFSQKIEARYWDTVRDAVFQYDEFLSAAMDANMKDSRYILHMKEPPGGEGSLRVWHFSNQWRFYYPVRDTGEGAAVIRILNSFDEFLGTDVIEYSANGLEMRGYHNAAGMLYWEEWGDEDYNDIFELMEKLP